MNDEARARKVLAETVPLSISSAWTDEEERQIIRAMLAFNASPDGWVLAPIKPTRQMVAIGEIALTHQMQWSPDHWGGAKAVWAAMISHVGVSDLSPASVKNVKQAALSPHQGDREAIARVIWESDLIIHPRDTWDLEVAHPDPENAGVVRLVRKVADRILSLLQAPPPTDEGVCVSPDLAARLDPAADIQPVGQPKLSPRRIKRKPIEVR